jgi:hypothetical protein
MPCWPCELNAHALQLTNLVLAEHNAAAARNAPAPAQKRMQIAPAPPVKTCHSNMDQELATSHTGNAASSTARRMLAAAHTLETHRPNMSRNTQKTGTAVCGHYTRSQFMQWQVLYVAWIAVQACSGRHSCCRHLCRNISKTKTAATKQSTHHSGSARCCVVLGLLSKHSRSKQLLALVY